MFAYLHVDSQNQDRCIRQGQRDVDSNEKRTMEHSFRGYNGEPSKSEDAIQRQGEQKAETRFLSLQEALFAL